MDRLFKPHEQVIVKPINFSLLNLYQDFTPDTITPSSDTLYAGRDLEIIGLKNCNLIIKSIIDQFSESNGTLNQQYSSYVNYTFNREYDSYGIDEFIDIDVKIDMLTDSREFNDSIYGEDIRKVIEKYYPDRIMQVSDNHEFGGRSKLYAFKSDGNGGANYYAGSLEAGTDYTLNNLVI